ncbi:MAG TPA: rhodanese-like domain-containing protein [Planctomycetia bacterium]|nr:rhodanese-like domain-containing protein [Planctomycetia bacterium]
MAVATIAPKELAARKSAGEKIELVDVRTPAEFREIHCEFARNVPLTDLDPARLMSGRTAGETLYLICHMGSRGKMACEKLQAAGYANVVNVEGGTDAWAQAGLPVRRGKKTMSLERQVRIAAGSLVLLGVLFSYFLHPYFIGLSAFVGAGLVFAGITDTCGMGMILARMPWNQVKPEPTVLSPEACPAP